MSTYVCAFCEECGCDQPICFCSCHLESPVGQVLTEPREGQQ